MSYEVTTRTVVARPIAAVRRRILVRDIAHAWKPALDQVWAFLRRHKDLRAGGHNVFLYHHPAQREAPMDVDFGVQVVRPFEGEGEVISTETPAGEVAATVHVGPYDGLGAAHDAVHAWRASSGRSFGGRSWEIYGDWNDDPAKLDTQVLYLLR
jgi:effector-binding domain-containing protein